jgi:hypothetical protein
MKQTSLFLQLGEEIDVQNLSAIPNDRLWNRVVNSNIHPTLRQPAMFELARRNEPRICELCSVMLSSEDIEEWFLGLKSLSNFGTDVVIQQLFVVARNSSMSKRRIIICELARSITWEYLDDFEDLARSLGVPGILDTRRWSPAALSALYRICESRGIDIVKKNAAELKKHSAIRANYFNTHDKKVLILLI